MLVNSNGLLSKALKEGYAIPSYNINNFEWTKYILEACKEYDNFVISSGCDIPASASWDNIEEYFNTVKNYNKGE